MDLSLLNVNTPPELVNKAMKDSLIGNLGITVTAMGDGFVEGYLLLSSKTSRPGGILHGGANLAMAETLAGLGSMILIDPTIYEILGSQVNGSHTGVLKQGKALAEAKIIHRGNKTHIWNVDVKNEEGKLISTIRVTNMIVKKND